MLLGSYLHPSSTLVSTMLVTTFDAHYHVARQRGAIAETSRENVISHITALIVNVECRSDARQPDHRPTLASTVLESPCIGAMSGYGYGPTLACSVVALMVSRPDKTGIQIIVTRHRQGRAELNQSPGISRCIPDLRLRRLMGGRKS